MRSCSRPPYAPALGLWPLLGRQGLLAAAGEEFVVGEGAVAGLWEEPEAELVVAVAV